MFDIICERCESRNVTNGAPHSEEDLYQVECHSCGYIKRIPLQNRKQNESRTTYNA